MTFHKWIDTFLSEKGIDGEEILQAEGEMGMNFIPVSALVDRLKGASEKEQKAVKDMIVKIDFHNGNVRHFLQHLCKAIAI